MGLHQRSCAWQRGGKLGRAVRPCGASAIAWWSTERKEERRMRATAAHPHSLLLRSQQRRSGTEVCQRSHHPCSSATAASEPSLPLPQQEVIAHMRTSPKRVPHFQAGNRGCDERVQSNPDTSWLTGFTPCVSNNRRCTKTPRPP